MRPDRRVQGVEILGRGRRVLGGQHVGVPRSGGVGDTAHGRVLAARSGLACSFWPCLLVLVRSAAAWRTMRRSVAACMGLATSGRARRCPATAGRSRGPSARRWPAAAGPGTARRPPVGRPRPQVRVTRWERARPHHRAGLLPVEVPAGQLLQVGGDHVRLPAARGPGHPFREPGHRVEQRLLARVREQARLEPLRSLAPAARGQRPAAAQTRRERARTAQHRRDCPAAARP